MIIPKPSACTLSVNALRLFLEDETGIKWNGIGDRVQPGKVLGAINVYQTLGKEDILNEFQSEAALMAVSVSLTADTHYMARNLAWDWGGEVAERMKRVGSEGITVMVGGNNKLLLRGCHMTKEGKVVSSEKYTDTQNSSLVLGKVDLFYTFPLEIDSYNLVNLWPSLG